MGALTGNAVTAVTNSLFCRYTRYRIRYTRYRNGFFAVLGRFAVIYFWVKKGTYFFFW